MKDQKFALVGGFIIVAVVFYFVGFSISSKEPAILGGGYDKGYKDGWEAARKAVEETGLFLPEPEEIFVLSGEIAKIENGILVVKADSLTMSPLDKEGPSERRVKVISNTRLTKLVAKSEEERLAEEEAFEKVFAEGIESMEGGVEPLLPPSPYKEEKINLSDLKTGERITVEAGENIKDKEEFEALTVRVQG